MALCNMKFVQTKEFREISDSHKSMLEARNYAVHGQLYLDDHLVRNARWKTYWRASKTGIGDVFVKINYGYDERTNGLYGRKEALLPAYFGSHCAHLTGIKFATVTDSWEENGEFAVVYKFETFSNRPIGSLVYDAVHHEKLLQFLKMWSEIPPPDWWGDEYVLNNFALQKYPLPAGAKTAPFGFDLGDNLGVDQSGNVVIYDFEFIQWAPAGLQDAYFNYFILGTGRNYLKLLFRKGFVGRMFHRVVLFGSKKNIKQGFRIYRERHLRNSSWRYKTSSYALMAMFLLYLASSFESKTGNE